MSTGEIFQYQSALQFLRHTVLQKKAANPSFSIRKWAAEMGMPNHTLLVFILQGKRQLTLKQIPYLAKGLELNSEEKLYFQVLVQMDRAETVEEKRLSLHWLNELHPGPKYSVTEIDEFSTVSDWIHSALLTLSEHHGLSTDPKEVHAHFRSRVSVSEITQALERLQRLQLLRPENGRLHPCQQGTTTKNDQINLAVRSYHRQVLSLAENSIEAQTVDERELQSLSLLIRPEQIPFAKELIRKFRVQFCKSLHEDAKGIPSDGDRPEVYQLNLQLFRLSERPSDPGQKVDKDSSRHHSSNGVANQSLPNREIENKEN